MCNVSSRELLKTDSLIIPIKSVAVYQAPEDLKHGGKGQMYSCIERLYHGQAVEIICFMVPLTVLSLKRPCITVIKKPFKILTWTT